MTAGSLRVARGQILIIANEMSTRDALGLALRLDGYRVTSVASGRQGVALAESNAFDLVLVDAHLPDVSGSEVVVQLVRQRASRRVVMIGADTTVETAIQLIAAGADCLLEQPWGPRRALEGKSVLERWLGYVMRVSCFEDDVKTLRTWARQAAISCSTLCAACRLVGVRPLDAKDFARVLRALRLGYRYRCPPHMLLDVCDARTLRKLSRKAGVDLGATVTGTSMDEFLTRQQFIDATNEVLPWLRVVLQSATFDERRIAASR